MPYRGPGLYLNTPLTPDGRGEGPLTPDSRSIDSSYDEVAHRRASPEIWTEGLSLQPVLKEPSKMTEKEVRHYAGLLEEWVRQIRAGGGADHLLDTGLIELGNLPEERLPIAFEDAGFEQLVDSIRDGGQIEPILVTRHPTKLDRWQLVYGRRRLEACRRLHIKVKARAKHIPNTETLLRIRWTEEKLTNPPSFFERARFIASLLDRKNFNIASAVRVVDYSNETLWRMRRVANIPQHVVDLFLDPRALSVRDLMRVVEFCEDGSLLQAADADLQRRPREPDLPQPVLEWLDRVESRCKAGLRPRADRAVATAIYDRDDHLVGHLERKPKGLRFVPSKVLLPAQTVDILDQIEQLLIEAARGKRMCERFALSGKGDLVLVSDHPGTLQ